ncbi:hypothetical protein BJ165DRAFT_1405252 [Panaeolus papilionaceus]|nr:hypothetical protein BJ165DRAFT_1405252 [Panaeolus papilionaceus]
MAQFIPFDVINHIIHSIECCCNDESDRRRTLVALTLVNKAFCDEATSHLYAHPPAMGKSPRLSLLVRQLSLSICEETDYTALSRVLLSAIEGLANLDVLILRHGFISDITKYQYFWPRFIRAMISGGARIRKLEWFSPDGSSEEISKLLELISIQRATLEFLAINFGGRRPTAVQESNHEAEKQFVRKLISLWLSGSPNDANPSEVRPIPNLKSLRISHWEMGDILFPELTQPGQITRLEITNPHPLASCGASRPVRYMLIPFEYDGKPERRRRLLETMAVHPITTLNLELCPEEEVLWTMQDIATALPALETLRITNPPTKLTLLSKDLTMDILRFRNLKFLSVYAEKLCDHFPPPLTYDSLQDQVTVLFCSATALTQVCIESLSTHRRTWIRSSSRDHSTTSMVIQEANASEQDSTSHHPLFDWESFGTTDIRIGPFINIALQFTYSLFHTAQDV